MLAVGCWLLDVGCWMLWSHRKNYDATIITATIPFPIAHRIVLPRVIAAVRNDLNGPTMSEACG